MTASFAESGAQTDVEYCDRPGDYRKPAQFGRGVISDVSDKLLDQFVSCVSGRFAATAVARWSRRGGVAGAEPSAARLQRLDGCPPRDEADTEQTIELEAVPAEEVPAEEVAATAAAAVRGRFARGIPAR